MQDGHRSAGHRSAGRVNDRTVLYPGDKELLRLVDPRRDGTPLDVAQYLGRGRPGGRGLRFDKLERAHITSVRSRPKGGPGGSSGGERALKVRVKTAKGRKLASTRWLQRQLNDPYVVRAADIPVEIRGGGIGTRQINNFLSADMFEADRLICVEVITPDEFTGEAIAGPAAGHRLQPLPSVLQTWASWTEAHPASAACCSISALMAGSAAGMLASPCRNALK